MTFEELGLDAETLTALARKGYEEPTPIQALAIPRLLQGTSHIVAQARTGTGKTAVFGLPLVQLLRGGGSGKPRALVLVPTRELAIQVCGEIVSYKTGRFPAVTPIYGGAAYGEQFRRLSAGVDIVVGTPGRVLDHMERGSLDISKIDWLVLDEADEMLDMGFLEDIEKVFAASNPEKRVLMFSATMPREILRVAREHLGAYETLIHESDEDETALTDQIWLEVHEEDKIEALRRIVDSEEEFYGIVFCATKVDTDELAKNLQAAGYGAEALHGDLSQVERERTLGRFRNKLTTILTATDVAARGIDVDRISHVINFTLPHDSDSYTHRIGRTGRAGNTGTAITFVTPDENRRLFFIKKDQGESLRKGKVPDVEAVLTAKRERIKTRVLSELAKLNPVTDSFPNAPDETEGAPDRAADDVPDAREEPVSSPWLTLADDVLAMADPRGAVAAALAAGFAGELDAERYNELRSVDERGVARLYIGAGRKDRFGKREVAAYIKQLSGLPDRLVDRVEVYEACSFVTVPFGDAERILEAARRTGKLPTVRTATPKGGSVRGFPRPRTGGGYRKPGGSDRPDRAGHIGYHGKKGPRKD
ncbi:MAG: DEAD/DEAH box helicase [Spirochaetes bacterium]|nr:DEAD/DEAH box helicase [Spirochaetota bacterium]